jgi:branched-chain amino acid transport system substrate-binding protein
MSARNILRTVMASLFIVVVLSACGAAATPVPTAAPPTAAAPNPNPTAAPAAAANAPIKIGLLTVTSGGLAALGKDCIDGFNLYLKEKGGVFAGHPIQLIVEDTTGDANVAVTKARKLVEQDGVDLLVGPLTGSEGYSVGAYAVQNKVTDFTTAGSDNLTKQLKSDYVLKDWVSSSGPSHPFADYAYNTLKWRTVALIGSDYAYPYEGIGGFAYRFQELGGKIVTRIWSPQDAPDYGPYLSQIPKTGLDGVFAVLAGADAVRFVGAYAFYGFKGTIPLAGHWNVTDASILDAEGDNALGIITTGPYAATIDTPENKAFVQKYQAAYGRDPSEPSEGLYSIAQAIEATLQGAGADYKDPVKFAAAYRKISIVSPRGKITVDDYNMVIQPMYFMKVEKVNGKLTNSVIASVPDVSQWGPYKPEDFLLRPPYDRDNPPIK